METEINIVEILKDKPQGTKLYSSACGKCKLEEVDDKSFKISFYNSKFGFMNGGEGYLDKNGKLYDDGECVVFPSKEMRDWRKFDWKKGDVLVNKDGDVYIIFERFVDDTYCSFLGKYYLWKENNDTEQFYEKERLLTSDFQKAGKDAVQTYISTIEERLGGNLNRETLVVEKPQPEFKPMDWCLMRDIRGEECFAWSLCQFAYQLKRGKYEAVGGMRFDECIPYNEETAHLLGTTDEWKGGEG